jgi:hypothetical protein
MKVGGKDRYKLRREKVNKTAKELKIIKGNESKVRQKE